VQRKGNDCNIVFFYGSIVAKKKTTKKKTKKKKTITFITFFDGFVAQIGYMCLFLWFCYKEGDGSNVVTFLYGGGVVEKAMAEGNFFSFIYLFCGVFGLIH
jgi:uncharacterized membrane protein